jgi:hypothetical protein
MTDKDLQNLNRKLDMLTVNMDWVKTQLSNHLKHHQAKEIALIGIAGSLIVALILAIIV